MKNKIIIIVLIFSANIYAQLIEPKAVKITEETQIEYQLLKLQHELNKQFKEEVNEGKEPIYIKFNIHDIEVNKNKATVNCEIIFGDYKESKLLKKQILIPQQLNSGNGFGINIFLRKNKMFNSFRIAE
jgi:hypothetical protein